MADAAGPPALGLPARAGVIRTPFALALMAASGFAGLGAQIVWTQWGALWLGAESAAVLGVVGAFFGGLALGALALGARIERSAQPRRWYAALEAVIGLWAALLVVAMGPATRWLVDRTGAEPGAASQWALAFGGMFALLLPATAAMGATLPAMARLLEHDGQPRTPLAALYASNTFGAVLGVLAVAFWLVPAFGLARSALACAALNLLCAALAWQALPAGAAARHAIVAAPARGVLPRLAATGLLGIAFEVLVVRVLSQVAENTVFTFAMLLAVYLVGTAAGAAVYARRAPGGDIALRDRLLQAQAIACLAGTATLWGAPALKIAVAQALGGGYGAALAAEAVLAVAAFGPPTLVMGALFSHLAQTARAGGIGFGRVLGVNTLGAALAAPLFGVVLLPLAGAKLALLAVAAGLLLLVSRAAWRTPWPAGCTAAVVGVGLLAPPLAIVDLPPGGRVVERREGATAAVSVVEDADGVQRLHIDNRQQEGSSATRMADARQALLPLLLHPAPKTALFLGLGTGVTAASAAQDSALQVDAVELLPDVIAASHRFTAGLLDGGAAQRLRLVAADARRHVRASNRRYDLVVADNFHPARSGSGALYTVEHFAAVRERLADGGLFCQWLPLHQLDLDTLRTIVASFLVVYPQGQALLATNSLETPVIGLVGRRDGARFDAQQVRMRIERAAWPQPPAAFGLGDEFAVLGSFAAGPGALARFAAGAPLNTDDHPVVAYRAPRITYAPDSRPRDRLLALLETWSVAPAELVQADAAFETRLAAYTQARQAFLVAGRDVRPAADARRMLEQVREPLLATLRTSPDFTPAYEPLLRMASALAHHDPAAARTLLADLARVAPTRPQAALALRALDGAAP